MALIRKVTQWKKWDTDWLQWNMVFSFYMTSEKVTFGFCMRQIPNPCVLDLPARNTRSGKKEKLANSQTQNLLDEDNSPRVSVEVIGTSALNRRR
jgi:hypothetical protein